MEKTERTVSTVSKISEALTEAAGGTGMEDKDDLRWTAYELHGEISNARLVIETAYLDVIDGINVDGEESSRRYRDRLNALLRAADCVLEEAERKMDALEDLLMKRNGADINTSQTVCS